MLGVESLGCALRIRNRIVAIERENYLRLAGYRLAIDLRRLKSPGLYNI